MNFDQALAKVLEHEGGWSNHPSDPGGRTMYGITETVARAHGYQGDLRELPQQVAADIYRAAYWEPIKADRIHPALRFDVFDAAVNSGVRQAVLWLQRSLGGVVVDGMIGPQTLEATHRNDAHAVRARFNGHRLRQLTMLKTWPHFGAGWARRVAINLIGE